MGFGRGQEFRGGLSAYALEGENYYFPEQTWTALNLVENGEVFVSS